MILLDENTSPGWNVGKAHGGAPRPTSHRSWAGPPTHEIRSGSHEVPNHLPNLFVAAFVASQTAPGHQNCLPSLILDSVWEPLWLQIGDSGPLLKPYYLK